MAEQAAETTEATAVVDPKAAAVETKAAPAVGADGNPAVATNPEATETIKVNGKEVKRWPLYYLFDDYRKTLDEVLRRPTPKAASAKTGRTWGKS